MVDEQVLVEIGEHYRSKNPDNTYMYFKVMDTDHLNLIKIKVHRDDDTKYTRCFRKGSEVHVPTWGDMFTVGRCKKMNDVELLAVML